MVSQIRSMCVFVSPRVHLLQECTSSGWIALAFVFNACNFSGQFQILCKLAIVRPHEINLLFLGQCAGQFSELLDLCNQM